VLAIAVAARNCPGNHTHLEGCACLEHIPELLAPCSHPPSTPFTPQVELQYLGLQDLSDLRSRAAAAATADAAPTAAGSGPLLDGIHLLEALLLAAALQQPRPAAAGSSPGGSLLPNGPLPLPGALDVTPTPPIAVPGALPGSSTAAVAGGTGLLGLAGSSNTGSSFPGAAAAAGGPNALLPGLAGSPAAAGLLSAGLSQSGLAGATALALPGAAGSNGQTAAAAAAERAAAAGFPGVRRVRVGDTVYFYAPGNPELHAPLGGGLEGWLGFKEVRRGGVARGGAVALATLSSMTGDMCVRGVSVEAAHPCD
jgi:hypothetical protein